MLVMTNTTEFPIGMTVLAIDVDRVELENMESMLKQCQYHATCTGEAITVLELVEDDKFNIDLIICDVDMFGIDGHKLFERLLNLNTEIPIILLSKSMNKDLVMQGITSGACEFMVKPVRVEQLQNIWRHVVRRKNNLKPKETNNPYWHHENYYEMLKAFSKIENFDHIPKSYKKRKFQYGEKKHEENEKHPDLMTRKRCRVVWTPDLHRKFVAAVEKLGLDKAVPKKILELMNDENLTRENVASHLQKYRLFLKKSSEKANNVTSCGSAMDSACDQNFSGFNNLRSIAGNARISHPVSANIGNSNGQVYSDIEQNVAIDPVAEFPYMSFGSSSWISDSYNPSKFRDLSGFQDDSLTSCVSVLPYIRSELNYQTQQFSHIVDHNMTQNMGYVSNGLISDYSNQLDHALCSSPGLFYEESTFPIVETCGLVTDTNLDDSQLDYDELMRGLWLEKQAMNSYNSDLVDDVTNKGELHIEYST